MNMREKVARVLAGQLWDRLFHADAEVARLTYPAGKEAYLDERWELYAPDADAVLDALMEPTDEMLSAFHSLTDDNGTVLVKTGYRAMIQAAKDGA